MAILDPKESVLRLLDPQPQDGTGPGFISALDMKTVCGNLYDQVYRVNLDVASLPDRGQLERIVENQQAFQQSKDRLLFPLITADGRIRNTLSTEDLARLLVRFVLDSPDALTVGPDVTIHDETIDVTRAFEVNEKYRGDTWFQWGNSTFEISNASDTQKYWWDGTLFVRVDTVTGQPNPIAVVPGDVFKCQNLPEITPEILYNQGMRGDDASWPEDGTGNFFTLSGGYTEEFFWEPSDGSTPGFFSRGRQP